METAEHSTIQPTTEELTAKVRRLIKSSRISSHHKLKAAAELVALGDGAIAILCTLTNADAKRRARMILIYSITIVFGWSARLIVELCHASPLVRVLALAIAGIGAFGNASLLLHSPAATRLLASLDDKRAIGSLLDALMTYPGETDLRDRIRIALVRLLPRLQASDAASLLPRHITALNQEIYHQQVRKHPIIKHDTVKLIVLKALEQVGDETSLPAVEKLIQTTDNAKVREAAKACFPFLQARAVMGKHTLLRAASQNSANLLLPAQGGSESETDMLLRAAIEPAGKP